VRRLQAFERAGADVLFAPGLPDLAAVRIVCSALTKAVQLHGRDARQIVRARRSGGPPGSGE